MIEKIGSAGLSGATGVAGNAGDTNVPGRAPQGGPAGAEGLPFDQILQQQAQPAALRFSAHAQQRLSQASVELGPRALAQLEAAVDKAGQKGGRASLILLDDLAFVVSVQNRMVITAVDAHRMADNVFTKIDSVVIARGQDTPGAAMALDVSAPSATEAA